MDVLEKPQMITHIEKSLNYTVFDVKWMPSSAKVVVLGSHPRDTGALQVYEVSNGELKLVLEVSFFWKVYIQIMSCHDSQSEKKHSFKCGSFGATSLHKRRFATGDFGGRLNIWQVYTMYMYCGDTMVCKTMSTKQRIIWSSIGEFKCRIFRVSP